MNKEDYEILAATMKPGQKVPEYAIRLLEETCARTNLDWKLRHVYLIERGGKWRVELSIDGFRAAGSRHEDYGGQEGPFWTVGPEGPWTDIPPENTVYAAKVGIAKKSGLVTWGHAKYKDYATGAMWTKFPSTMTAKCAEMLAWRKALPGVFGGLYGTEEMSQANPATPLPPVLTEGDVDNLKNQYILKLNAAKTKDEIGLLGREIAADKSLPIADVQELHKLYTELKNK